MTAEYHELPENFTIESWGDLADDLLCAGVAASVIKDALVDVWPDYQWFAKSQLFRVPYGPTASIFYGI